MTLGELKKNLKENSGRKLCIEQIAGIKETFGKDITCHIPIASSKGLIAASVAEKNFVILHENGRINKNYYPKEENSFGLYTWTDTKGINIILAYPQ